MTTLFTRIIAGQIPGSFVHRDPVAVAFMTINPITDGHLLVVPVREVDQWTDLTDDENRHIFNLAQTLARALKIAFDCNRVGLIIAGYEVPHCHIHVIPTNSLADLNFANAAESVDRAVLDDHAGRLVSVLSSLE